jgi:hypothetical protein
MLVHRHLANHYRQLEASSGNIWTVPWGGLGRLIKIGYQPASMTTRFYGPAVHLSGASSWGMRIQIGLPFPKLTEKEKMMMEEKLKEMDQEKQRMNPARLLTPNCRRECNHYH